MSSQVTPALPQKLCALPRDGNYLVLREPHIIATDLATKLLEFDPERRMNAKAALSHEFLRELSDPSDEVCLACVSLTTQPTCATFSFPSLETMNLQELRSVYTFLSVLTH